MQSLFEAASLCLAASDPFDKVRLTRQAAALRQSGLALGDRNAAVTPISQDVGRPAKPELVHPRELPRRRLSSVEGRAALLHAVAHIEFNAINLAWDAVYRFRDFPESYYDDWLSVALDESRHFAMIDARLREWGYAYGDLPAHNGLWQMAVDTGGDRVARMALVPRLLEARGLDVTPGMRAKLIEVGDQASADLLAVILSEEEGHVLIGTRWFVFACEQAGLDHEQHFQALIEEFFNGRVKGPFNRPARMRAGFTENEMAFLEDADRQG